jgi:hypothetical protein
MRLKLLPRLLIAGVLALGALALAAGLRPEGAKAAPVVCAEVLKNPSGVPIVRWTCLGLGGVAGVCFHEGHPVVGPIRVNYCVDLG